MGNNGGLFIYKRKQRVFHYLNVTNMNFDVSSEASSVDSVGSKYPIVLCALEICWAYRGGFIREGGEAYNRRFTVYMFAIFSIVYSSQTH